MLTFSDPGFTKSAWSPQPSQTTQGNILFQNPAPASPPPHLPLTGGRSDVVSTNPQQSQK